MVFMFTFVFKLTDNHLAISMKVHNNNVSNGEVRDSEKTMRGLKKTDTPILKRH